MASSHPCLCKDAEGVTITTYGDLRDVVLCLDCAGVRYGRTICFPAIRRGAQSRINNNKENNK